MSPKGNLAVSIQAEGFDPPEDGFYHDAGGTVAVLAIDGDKVTKVGSVTVGALPEAVSLQRRTAAISMSATSSTAICRYSRSTAPR